MNIYGPIVLAASSGIMGMYSGVARQRSWPVGTFFLGPGAPMLGIVGLLVSLVLGNMAIGFWGIVIALLTFGLLPAILVVIIGPQSQVVSLLGFAAGIVVAFF